MRFKVYLLRRRGVLLPWREVLNGPSYIGDLRTHEVLTKAGWRFFVATLQAPDPVVRSQIPDLYEPVLTAIAPLALRLRGFETIGQGTERFAVVQEWHCEMPVGSECGECSRR